ncbi:IS21 family transposase [Candidatus Riflebacteria bacterium]
MKQTLIQIMSAVAVFAGVKETGFTAKTSLIPRIFRTGFCIQAIYLRPVKELPMISKELENQILRLYHIEKWRYCTIARILGIHHSTVQRVLGCESSPKSSKKLRGSIADPYLPFIKETLEKYPDLTSRRIFEMVRERGYPGGPDYFRLVISRVRPRKVKEAFLRVRTLPGEQAQVDWAYFGKLNYGKAIRRLSAFVMVLSWSRQIFVWFYLNEKTGSFLSGHQKAFEFFGGVPKIILYDNLKSAVLERRAAAIRFNPLLLEFAAHYRYEPRPVGVGRGNEKGRVERAIRYIRSSFFAARKWHDIVHLNEMALNWCQNLAGNRPFPEDKRLTVNDAFKAEREKLSPLREDLFPAYEKVVVSVGKSPFVRFDLNDYSIPCHLVQRNLTVQADENEVKILDGVDIVAVHSRSYDRGNQIENPTHLSELLKQKRAAGKHRAIDRLHYVIPNSQELLTILAERGTPLAGVINGLFELLERFGAHELEQSIDEALQNDTIHIPAIRQILDRRLFEKDCYPLAPIPLPDKPEIRNITVRPHRLHLYDMEELDEE